MPPDFIFSLQRQLTNLSFGKKKFGERTAEKDHLMTFDLGHGVTFFKIDRGQKLFFSLHSLDHCDSKNIKVDRVPINFVTDIGLPRELCRQQCENCRRQ